MCGNSADPAELGFTIAALFYKRCHRYAAGSVGLTGLLRQSRGTRIMRVISRAGPCRFFSSRLPCRARLLSVVKFDHALRIPSRSICGSKPTCWLIFEVSGTRRGMSSKPSS